jgi:hypothetical protein
LAPESVTVTESVALNGRGVEPMTNFINILGMNKLQSTT